MKRVGIFLLLLAANLSPTRAASPETTQDTRITIAVSNKERNQTLFEMRAFLEGFFSIQAALARHDNPAIASMARYIQTTFQDTANSLTSVHPEGYDQMSGFLIDSFGAVARAAEKMPSRKSFMNA
jgi:hypothetical protein